MNGQLSKQHCMNNKRKDNHFYFNQWFYYFEKLNKCLFKSKSSSFRVVSSRQILSYSYVVQKQTHSPDNLETNQQHAQQPVQKLAFFDLSFPASTAECERGFHLTKEII